MKIAIIYGGISFERSVSIKTSKSILDNIDKQYEIILIDFDGDLNKLINAIEISKVDLVFNALHGGDGENGVIQKLLEKKNILFTGSGSSACEIAMNKYETRNICIKNEIPVPYGILLNQNNKFDVNGHFKSGLVVLKPVNEGSSADLYVIKNNSKTLEDKIEFMIDKYGSFLVEEYIDGRELTIGIVGDSILPIVEIIPKNKFYDYKCKYSLGMSSYEVPAEIATDVKEKINKYSLELHHLIGCRHYSRIDVKLDSNNNIYLLEINTLPGMTQTSLLPKAARTYGITFSELIDKIINLAK